MVSHCVKLFLGLRVQKAQKGLPQQWPTFGLLPTSLLAYNSLPLPTFISRFIESQMTLASLALIGRGTEGEPDDESFKLSIFEFKFK